MASRKSDGSDRNSSTSSISSRSSKKKRTSSSKRLWKKLAEDIIEPEIPDSYLFVNKNITAGPFPSVGKDLGVGSVLEEEDLVENGGSSSRRESCIGFEGGVESVDVDGSDVNCESDLDDQWEEAHESDYDTDLEINTHKWIYPEKYDHDSTGISKYKRACEEEGVEPISIFMKQIQDEDLDLKHHGLNTAELRALSAPLESDVDCNIRDEDKTNTTIESINLEGNWIMGEGTSLLCKVLKENVFVTHLNLAENKIDSEGVKPVCSLLMDNKHIEYLNLSGNDIGNHAAESFFQLLTTNTVVKSLNLRHNKFEDCIAHYFKDALMENETLQVLDLSWNCFMSKGCVQLAEGLKENVGLKECSLAMNGFGVEGGIKIGEAIKHNRTLRRLDVSYCRLPKEAAHELGKGLNHNDILKSFDISNNFIQDDGAFEILSAIDQNESSGLRLLDLGTTIVHDNFNKLEEKLKEERNLVVIHGGVGYAFVNVKRHRRNPMEAFLRDPMTKLKLWVEEAGYRLIDLFRRFDKDNSQSMSHEEFKRGIRKTGIAITDEQLDILIARLDVDWDGEIDFKELLDGDKHHRKAKRDVQKIILEEERLAREENKKIQGGQFAIIAAGATRKVARRSSMAY